MKTIFYKKVIIWAPYPFQDEVDEKYAVFYERVKKKFIMMFDLRMNTETSIKEKEEYLKKELNIKEVKVIKLK